MAEVGHGRGYFELGDAKEKKQPEKRRVTHRWLILGATLALAVIFIVLYADKSNKAQKTYSSSVSSTYAAIWQWQASIWGVNGLCSSRIATRSGKWNLDGFLAELEIASDELSGLGITATLWDHFDGSQVTQFTAGDLYCTDVVWCNFTQGWTPNTVHAVYSNSKAVTALVFLRSVVDAGLGSLDETLAESLPRIFSKSEAALATPRMIFSHTSGLVEVIRSAETECYINDFRHPNFRTEEVSLEDCVTQLANKPVDYPPGSQFSYSDLSFEVIALLIENKTGVSFEANFQEHVARPLGMNSSSFVCNTSSSTVTHPHPAIGLCTTANDMARFNRWLLLGGGGSAAGSASAVAKGASGGSDSSSISRQTMMSPQTRMANLTAAYPGSMGKNFPPLLGMTRCVREALAGASASNLAFGGAGASNLGYGLGMVQSLGFKAETWYHPGHMGALNWVATGRYSVLIAASYASNVIATNRFLRAVEQLERDNDFLLSKCTDAEAASACYASTSAAAESDTGTGTCGQVNSAPLQMCATSLERQPEGPLPVLPPLEWASPAQPYLLKSPQNGF